MRPAADASAAATDPIQDEVVANIRAQRIGEGTCAEHTASDLNLPEAFLRRIADRVIRSSFEERFRLVVHDRAPAPAAPALPGAEGGAIGDVGPLPFAVLKGRASEGASWANSLPEELRPALRGYRAPIGSSDEWPLTPPDSFSEAERQATTHVARRLAADGLGATLAHIRPLLGLSKESALDHDAVAKLRAVGFPVDLLGLVASGFQGAAGEGIRPSCPGFRVATETGDADPGAVRLHLTRGDYWDGPRSGSNLGVVRDLVGALPGARFLIHIRRQHLPVFAEHARGWPAGTLSRITVAPSDLPLSQWAQDNAKPGTVLPGGAGSAEVITLVPRFASRSEEAPSFIPGDTLALAALERWGGQRVVQSPLLFQGGNLLAVDDPVSRERVLLLGEAEVHRNTALGLSSAQVLEAFKVEMGVDRCVVLPAASFHIDYELTVRTFAPAGARRVVAFVNDTGAAARVIVTCCIRAMETHRLLTRRAADQARTFLARSDAVPLYQQLVTLILTPTDAGPVASESHAPVFSVGEGDSGVANIHRFLLAMDFLLATCTDPRSLPLDPQFKACLASFRRREVDRAEIVRILEGRGWSVARVPSMSDGNRGVNYLNGIHTAASYLMPVWGGLFRPLDDVAAGAFRRHLGPAVELVQIASGESQRRAGSLHCSASIYLGGGPAEGRRLNASTP